MAYDRDDYDEDLRVERQYESHQLGACDPRTCGWCLEDPEDDDEGNVKILPPEGMTHAQGKFGV